MLLYTREKRFADVLKLTRELSAKYPRNYLLRLETAEALVSLAGVKRKENDVAGAVQAEKEAFATFDELLRDRNTAARALDLIHFKYGEALLMAGYNDRAAKEFLATTKVDRGEAGLITMAHLYAARSYDWPESATKQSRSTKQCSLVQTFTTLTKKRNAACGRRLRVTR